MAITTNTEYKAWAGITSSDFDTLLTTLISSESRTAERICGRTLTTSGTTSFESATYTETFNGEGVASVQLSNTPITSITSVTLLAGDGSTINTYASTDFKFNPTTGVLELTPSYWGRFTRDEWGDSIDGLATSVSGQYPNFPQQFRNVQVVYVGGYSTVPDNLKVAIWKLVNLEFNARGQDPAVKSESIGVRNVTYSSGPELESRKAEILRDFRRYVP